MAKPRVFVSSTYYDLKHLRSSLENFIESLGFDPVLSEKGDIAFSPDIPLDESCYVEASNADIFVLIIGGRYGSESSGERKKLDHTFYDRYDSITKQEYRKAIERNVPAYILIDTNVYAEYRTFLRNKDNESIRYAHVDSVNIFHLIEEVLSQPKNNPVYPFERYSDIEEWLREQWAGVFKELLGRMAAQQQISTFSQKVAELGEINHTLRRYLEEIISKLSPQESEKIIESEAKRLEKATLVTKLKENVLIGYLTESRSFTTDECIAAISSIRKFETAEDDLKTLKLDNEKVFVLTRLLRKNGPPRAQRDFNEARILVGLDPLAITSAPTEASTTT